MIANVVKLPRARTLVSLLDSPSTLKLIRDEILRHREGYTALSRKAGIANSTVSNIASGTTRWPRLETVIRLLSALGWTVQATRIEEENHDAQTA